MGQGKYTVWFTATQSLPLQHLRGFTFTTDTQLSISSMELILCQSYDQFHQSHRVYCLLSIEIMGVGGNIFSPSQSWWREVDGRGSMSKETHFHFVIKVYITELYKMRVTDEKIEPLRFAIYPSSLIFPFRNPFNFRLWKSRQSSYCTFWL